MNESAEINIEGSRVLIVDDDEIIRKLLRRVLERNGLLVDEANSGEQAMTCIENAVPDLILLDVVMDGMDGFQTCQRVKALEIMKEVPIIFVTGRSDTGSIVEGLDAGGSDYITKPINRHEAVARIRNHLKMRALMRFQKEFIDMLKQANFAKNRVIGVASHDLRNPLVSIRGLSEFVESCGPLTEEQAELVRTIRATSDSMLHLVEELLDLSVIESGEERLELQPHQVGEILSSSLNIYQFTANKKSISLELNNGGMPALLNLDKMQFRRLIDNLLSNAVKYSPPESKILMHTALEGDRFLIVIEDEGPGIPEEDMHKMFTDFGRTSNQPTGNETSTGLGLSICKKIVESHSGRIYVENRTDRSGARFVVDLDISRLRVDQSDYAGSAG